MFDVVKLVHDTVKCAEKKDLPLHEAISLFDQLEFNLTKLDTPTANKMLKALDKHVGKLDSMKKIVDLYYVLVPKVNPQTKEVEIF